MDSMRSFVENKITTQDLINKSIVLVNGVRIGVDLEKGGIRHSAVQNLRSR